MRFGERLRFLGPLSDHKSVVIKNKIYIYGGYMPGVNKNTCQNHIAILDTSKFMGEVIVEEIFE